MSVVLKPKHIFEPNPLACGQAVLAMITGIDVNNIIELCNTDRETTLTDMKRVLEYFNIKYNPERKQAFYESDLPDIALLSLETPKCWHWSLFFNGIFYDPEYGELKSFPPSYRRFYWEIYK